MQETGRNGPWIRLGKVRLTASNFPAAVFNKALAPEGVLVIATCGYYKGDPIHAISPTQAYRKQWEDNLKAMAKASPSGFRDVGQSYPDPDLVQATVSTPSYTLCLPESASTRTESTTINTTAFKRIR